MWILFFRPRVPDVRSERLGDLKGHLCAFNWREIAISNNVGGVKTFSSTLRPALRVRAPFRSCWSLPKPTSGSLLIVAGQELSSTQPSLRSQLRSWLLLRTPRWRGAGCPIITAV